MANLLSHGKPIAANQKRNNPFLAIQDELDKAVDSFNRWFNSPNFYADQFEKLNLFPAMDIIEDQNSFKVEVEMPGMGEEDVKVAINNGILTIKGEKTTAKQDKDKNYLMREIGYGSYERNISLPDTIDASQAKASFKKGMLWVNIPKKSEAIKERQEIKVEKAH